MQLIGLFGSTLKHGGGLQVWLSDGGGVFEQMAPLQHLPPVQLPTSQLVHMP